MYGIARKMNFKEYYLSDIEGDTVFWSADKSDAMTLSGEEMVVKRLLKKHLSKRDCYVVELEDDDDLDFLMDIVI